MAESRAVASKAMELFTRTYEAKYPKAVACFRGDREELLAFYDFPAEHWRHLRTSNPLESLFATVRQRSSRTKGCGSRDATLLALKEREEQALLVRDLPPHVGRHLFKKTD